MVETQKCGFGGRGSAPSHPLFWGGRMGMFKNQLVAKPYVIGIAVLEGCLCGFLGGLLVCLFSF